MKIKHVVMLSEDEEKALFDIGVIAAMETYPSVEEQAAALKEAFIRHRALLNRYMVMAFKAGRKYKKYKKSLKPKQSHSE